MTVKDNEVTPLRGSAHDALSVFLGEWSAEGVSFGGTDQSGANPKANGVPWISTHSTRWHTGEFFLIQDECAQIGTATFDTVSVMGVDQDGNVCFARTFENDGFYRHYALSVDGRTWMLEGETDAPALCSPPMATRRRSLGNGCGTANGCRSATG